MKLLVTLLTFIPLLAFGGEAYFFTLAGKPTGQKIEGEKLHLVLPIQKMNSPAASSIIAFHQGLGQGREYQIQVSLKTNPKKGWIPMLKLEQEIIMEGISVSRPDDARFASSFSLEADDPKKIKRWCQLLGELMEVPEGKIQIDLTKAEQNGADQPATALDPKPEGKEKTQPESEGRSQ